MLVNVLGLLIVVSTSVSAFSSPFGTLTRQRTTFASAPVFMSDAETSAPEIVADEKPTNLELTTEEPTNLELTTEEPTNLELTTEEHAAKRKVQRERYTLFVGNLPFDIAESDIKSIFEPHGKVELVNIPRDRMTQKPRGFAFVDMGSAEELEAAIADVDGSTFQTRQIRVSKSVGKDEIIKTKKPKPERTLPQGTKKIYMGNIPFSATKEELMEFYAEYGEVVDVFIPPNPETGDGRGFAFITMKEEDVEKAIEGTNGVEYGGRRLVVNEPLPPGKKVSARNTKSGRTKLYVGNLSFYTVAETLMDIFGEFGEVTDCYLPEDTATGGSRGFGFVTMARADALRAIKEIDGCEVDGRVIRVNEAQPKGRGGGEQQNGSSMGDDEFGVISGSWDDMDDQ